MKTIRAVLAMSFIMIAFAAGAQMGEIRGVVTDSATGNPIEGVTVSITYKGYPKMEVTDASGKYSFKPIEPGTYDVVFSVFGKPKPYVTEGAQVNPETITFIDRAVGTGIVLTTTTIYADKIDMRKDPGTISIPAKDFSVSAGGRGFQDVLTTQIPGVQSIDKGGKQLAIRGSRPDATQVYVDGVKIYGEAYIPNAGVEDVTVITGGLPAKYGDTTSGVILITTKSFR